MIRITFTLLLFCFSIYLKAQPLKISENGRFLVKSNNTPFFWLGDTGWEMIHRLNKEEASYYMKNRSGKGFNVIMTVVLSEMNGITVPNAEGNLPLIDKDPEKPNEAFFAHLDYIVKQGKLNGLYLGLVPTWGAYLDDKKHPLFDNVPLFLDEKKAAAFGKFMGARYKDADNIIWIAGGDRSANGHEKIWEAMIKGIRSGGAKQLLAYHPTGGESSADYPELASLLDFNMYQSGHERIANSNYARIKTDYEHSPAKPVIDAEPNYEDGPLGFNPANGRFNDFNVRNASYWSVFAGGFGINYGHNSVWQMYEPGKHKPIVWAISGWKKALEFPGSNQLQYLKKLVLSRPYLSRIPDQSITDQPQTERTNHIQVTRDGTAGSNDASYIMIYYPYLSNIAIKTTVIAAKQLHAWWFNPRTGAATDIGILENKGLFSVPYAKQIKENQAGPDWVLVIDDALRNYPAPGTRSF